MSVVEVHQSNAASVGDTGTQSDHSPEHAHSITEGANRPVWHLLLFEAPLVWHILCVAERNVNDYTGVICKPAAAGKGTAGAAGPFPVLEGDS